MHAGRDGAVLANVGCRNKQLFVIVGMSRMLGLKEGNEIFFSWWLYLGKNVMCSMVSMSLCREGVNWCHSWNKMPVHIYQRRDCSGCSVGRNQSRDIFEELVAVLGKFKG